MKQSYWVIAALIAASLTTGQYTFSQENPPAQAVEVAPVAYSVKDFGAVGDGKADDTQAIQKGLSTVGKQGTDSATLFFPPGTYRITETLTIKAREQRVTKIMGSGANMFHGVPTAIVWDGPEDGTMLDVVGYTQLHMCDLRLEGNTKAGVLYRINSRTGYGAGQFYTERVHLNGGRIGIEIGADKDMNAADMTFVDLHLTRMTDCGFRTVNTQNVNYVFIRSGASWCPIGFHFKKGGSGNFVLPLFGWLDVGLKIDGVGINNGGFNISGLWMENFGYTDKKKRMVIVQAQGEANISMSGFSTVTRTARVPRRTPRRPASSSRRARR